MEFVIKKYTVANKLVTIIDAHKSYNYKTQKKRKKLKQRKMNNFKYCIYE